MYNPVQYTSRTFNTILNDLNNDPDFIDKPDWVKKLFAGIGDVLSMAINAAANQATLSTAFTEQAVDRLLQLIDYQRSGRITSYGYVHFYISDGVTFPFIVTKEDLVGYSEGSAVVSSMRFEAIANETFSAVSETFIANATTDQLTVASVYNTGACVKLTTTGALPAASGGGLSASERYYAIYVDATHIRLARSIADAYAGTYINLTDAGTGTHTAHRYSKEVLVYQRETKDMSVIGTSDGFSEWQEFNIPFENVLVDTVEIETDSIAWSRVNTFVYSSSADTHYRVIAKEDGALAILFGNGTYGAIPGNFSVELICAVGGGSNSNVMVLNKVNSYGGSDSNLNGISNYTVMQYGAERESTNKAVYLAPMLLKARDRFVTSEDGESLAATYPGVSRAKVVTNWLGPLTAQVVIVPTGGGTPSSILKTAVSDFLTERSILESISITVSDPTYQATNVTAAIKVLSGYTYAALLPMIELAFRFLTSELTYEIREIMLSEGIAIAVSYINTLWGYSFSTSDYSQIFELLYNVNPPQFGVSFQASDFYALVELVEGVDYLTMSSPTFPVTFASNTISTTGTLTLSEIV